MSIRFGSPAPLAGLLLLVAARPVPAGVWNGSLETRFESDSWFEAGNYLEQWLWLDYRDRDSNLAWNLSGNWGLSRSESWMYLHSAWVEKRLPGRNLSIRAGRFDRYDPSGAWTLDGLALEWSTGTTRWELYGGAPGRREYYLAPDRDDSVDQPAADFMAGVAFTRPLETGSGSTLQDASWGLGARLYGRGDSAWKLDGRFGGSWQLPGDLPVARLDAALVFDTEATRIESFDFQATLPHGEKGQVVLRGRRYDPPEEPVTFRDRYYRYYATGWQTVVETGYDGRLRPYLQWSGYLRAIDREMGLEGGGAELTLRWTLREGTLEGHTQWLQGGGEHAGGLFLGYALPLNSRLLLDLNGALRHEQNDLYGRKTVVAGEARLQWMWSRGLQLDSHLELVHADDEDGGYDQVRLGLRLVYRLPASGMEDYR